MEKDVRKVQLTGGSTFTVSIPKKWAKENGVKPGSLLKLYPHPDGSLVVRTKEQKNGKKRETTLSIHKEKPRNLKKLIQALYVVGVDKIRIKWEKNIPPKQRRTVLEATSGLMGFEIVEEEKNELVLQSLLSTSEISIPQTVIRLKLVAISMHRNAIRSLSETDSSLAKHVIERDNEADKLFAMVARYFQRTLTDLQETRKLKMDHPTIFDYYSTARQLERIADHAEKIANIAVRQEKKDLLKQENWKKIVSLSEKAIKVVDEASDLILENKSSKENALKALKQKDELIEEIEQLDRKLYEEKREKNYHLVLILDSIKRTSEYGTNIAEKAILKFLREKNLKTANF